MQAFTGAWSKVLLHEGMDTECVYGRGGCEGRDRARTGRGADRNVLGSDRDQDILARISAVRLCSHRKTCSTGNDRQHLKRREAFLCYQTSHATICFVVSSVSRKPRRWPVCRLRWMMAEWLENNARIMIAGMWSSIINSGSEDEPFPSAIWETSPKIWLKRGAQRLKSEKKGKGRQLEALTVVSVVPVMHSQKRLKVWLVSHQAKKLALFP